MPRSDDMNHAELLLEDFDQEDDGYPKDPRTHPATQPRISASPEVLPHGLARDARCLSAPLRHVHCYRAGHGTSDSQLSDSDLTFTTREHLLASSDDSQKQARAALAAASDAHLAEPRKFSFGGHPMSHDTQSKTYRLMFFNHLIHHRAQPWGISSPQ